MGHAINMGRDPRTITEDLLRHLRNAFLSLMAPELVVLPSDRVDAVAQQAQQLGAAGIVRAIERLGSSLVDMRHAPDPRILVEVALVQLTNDEAGGDADAMLARLERLEQKVKGLATSATTGGTPASATPRPSAPTDPATGRAVLGGAARRDSPSSRPNAAAPPTETAAEPSPAAAAPEAAPEPAASTEPPAPSPAAAPSISVPDAWEQQVKGSVKPLVRALYTAGSFIGQSQDGSWQFSVPNEAHGAKCNDHRADVEAALSAATGSPVTIEFVVGGHVIDDAPTPPRPTTRPAPVASSPEPAAPRPSAVERAAQAAAAMPDEADEVRPDPAALPADDEIDVSELTDAPPESVKTPIDRLAEAFPGSELINDD
jgi:DNA polymerase-3 subunit gamma/tau